jgi:hypothetical protein
MAKRLALVLALLFLPALAMADTIDTVSLAPTTFNLGPLLNPNSMTPPPMFETVSLSFTWDITTNVLSNMVLTATGPGGTLPNTPQVLFTPFGIDLLNFVGPTSIFQISNEGAGSGTVIPSDRLGTFVVPTFFVINGGHVVSDGSVTVSRVAAPEPGSLLQLLIGLGALGLGTLVSACITSPKRLPTNFAAAA